ncbi:hypothetical protein [Arthrobacter sp. MYb213]|uniref:hypothetical protein n=1 Tax=Arthrobacter sp. MYb213 TaxID=1848595 RepID=UPI000CFDC789|nr:hypothetical protein [Arthrobacter sp. MYb213]PRB69504.1 hypothetical protein CQ011_12135 [Arthrobacter sp. MYb213]
MSNPKMFRKLPVEIEAKQLSVANRNDIFNWAKACTPLARVIPCVPEDGTAARMLIHTLEGTMKAEVGDWIIRGVQGEFYPCKPDIFEATYEAVSE